MSGDGPPGCPPKWAIRARIPRQPGLFAPGEVSARLSWERLP
jgi:hypothetical protein